MILPPFFPSLLLPWFRSTRKPLPWRTSPPDPYFIWVSEIMLQQTRIEAVIPYFLRFTEAFPDIHALAAADEDSVLRLWQGLGYYSRARNLHKTARILAESYGGSFPRDPALLRKLPGIGDYTAGAIASIAFGLPEPAVDGNVLRVLARFLASADDIALPGTRRAAADALREIYPTGDDAGAFTEGLMELGETVCIPGGEPRCALCPLRDSCAAHAAGTEEDYPVKTEKKPRRIEDRTVLILRDSAGRLAIRRRSEAGLLSGLWEFPNCGGCLGEEEVRAALAEAGVSGVRAVRLLPPTRHIFTHVEWRMTWYEVECGTFGGCFTAADEAELREKYAMPKAFFPGVRGLDK